MNFLNHYCFKQLFSGGIEPPTSAEEVPLLPETIVIKFYLKSFKALNLLTLM